MTPRDHGPAVLLDAIRRLAFARDIDTVTQIVRVAARTLTAADGVTVILRSGDECYYADEDAIAPLWKGRRFPMRACISGWVMLHGERAVIPDVYADPRIPVDAYRPTFVKSLAMVPVGRERPLAAIGAYWAMPHAASDDEVGALQDLADATGLAIANVELYEDLRAAVRREVQARKAAEAASRAKDEFLATLSHELRTPLNAILGWARLLSDGVVDGEARVRAAADAILRNSLAQCRLVEALIDAAAAARGTLAVTPTSIDISKVVADAIGAVRTSADRKEIRIAVLDRLASSTMVGDADRLRQVVTSLLSNAVKFSPPDRVVDVTLHGDADHVTVAVTDRGDGMSPEFVPRAFEPFVQADAATTRRHAGLGLGLAIARQIVLLHGGEIRAESAGPGTGSTFAVRLPRR